MVPLASCATLDRCLVHLRRHIPEFLLSLIWVAERRGRHSLSLLARMNIGEPRQLVVRYIVLVIDLSRRIIIIIVRPSAWQIDCARTKNDNG
jgi:hypothetical protein